jgi:hypothetical protein
MRIPRLGLSLLFLVGCAGLPARGRNAPSQLAVGETHWDTCFPGRSFGGDETALVQMREQGATTTEIARKLGGAPQEIRCWEARLHNRGAASQQMAIAGTRK